MILKGYFQFTVITVFLYSLCVTIHPWGYYTPNSLFLPYPTYILCLPSSPLVITSVSSAFSSLFVVMFIVLNFLDSTYDVLLYLSSCIWLISPHNTLPLYPYCCKVQCVLFVMVAMYYTIVCLCVCVCVRVYIHTYSIYLLTLRLLSLFDHF